MTEGEIKMDRFEVRMTAFENPMMIGKTGEEVDSLGQTLNVPPAPRRVSFDRNAHDVSSPPLPDIFSDLEDGSYQATHEALPRMELYRNALTMNKRLVRPTLDELHNAYGNQAHDNYENLEEDEKPLASGAIKFGWIRGVYMRCLLNIWGVLLFLRMGWMVGQAGMGLSLVIVGLATVVTILTTLSMSAICTNGEVGGGGVYYLVSRILGPEVGGAVGILFSFATSVAVAMYIVGAAETVRDLLRSYDTGISQVPSADNDIRIAGVILLIIMYLVTGVGMLFENSAQIVLLIILIVALIDYFVGACLVPTEEQLSKGFTGWNAQVAKENFVPDFRGETFFGVFSVFFPSVIGITAGANISGDLKDPSFSIPKGTMLAIISTSGSYILIIVWLGCTVIRDATGNVEDVLNNTYWNCTGRECPHGLQNYNQVMEMSAGFGPLIYGGIFAASLSSALAALMSAPKIFQALCKDRIFPSLYVFAKGYGAQGDPRRASGLAFLIALVFTLIAELNAIAPIISNFFMATYGLVNFACFHASLVKAPGFRPGFKYYNKWLSLVGAILCFIVMFIMNWITAVITWIILFAIYLGIQKSKTGINWGSSTVGFTYNNALSALIKLNKSEDHVKNYRPAILVLTGNPSSRPPLVDFTHTITRKQGLMICGHVMKGSLSHSMRKAMVEHNYQWLITRKVQAFYNLLEADVFSEGVKSLIQISGLGKMKPNVLFIGYKTHWQECDADDLHEYLNVIHLAFDMHMSLAVLRLEEGLDYAKFFETEIGIPYADAPNSVPPLEPGESVPMPDDNDSVCESVIKNSLPTMGQGDEGGEDEKNGDLGLQPSFPPKLSRFRRLNSLEAAKVHPREAPPEVLAATNQFQQKQKKGTIDVWWLSDDGGLTILIPYLLSQRSQWKDCELRVFSVAHSENELDHAQVNMTSLLKKFRINFASVTVLPSVDTPPTEQSKACFMDLMSKWITKDDTCKNSMTVTATDITLHKEKTNRHLRIKELVAKNSSNATAIIMTLPMPRRGACPAPLYLAWLEVLTKDLPPVLLVRGNQTSVLTFYS